MDTSYFVATGKEDFLMARKPAYEKLEQRVEELDKEAIERNQAENALRENDVKPVTEAFEAPHTGNERILFVDDEEEVVEMEKKILERLGYQVDARTRSIEALEAFRAQPDKFDVVITDMTMPHMTGEMLARELMAIRPNIPIILCTGCNEMISEEKAKAVGIREFFVKPVRIRDLAKTIRKMLD
jgi:CheY-like chemotaxis protein